MPQQTTSAPRVRTVTLTVRLSADEDAALCENARSARMSIPDYARHVLICGKIVNRERVRLPFRLRIQLERIAVNLRQLRALDGDERLRAEVRRVHARLDRMLTVELDAFFAERGTEDAHGNPLDIVRAVRLSVDQREVIEALAQRCGMTLSAYARDMLTHGHVTVFADREAEFPDLDDLKAIGVRINEATHQANIDKRLTGALPPLLVRLEPHLDRIARD